MSQRDPEVEDVIRALLVEDNPADAEIVAIDLEEAGGERFQLTHVPRLNEAIERLRSEPFDVALLDLTLPDSRGIETVARFRAEAPDVAIVVMTGSLDERLSLEAAEHGAESFLVKGEAEGALLLRTLVYAIRQHGSRRQLELERNASEYRATHDPLTRLPNRMLFMDRLNQALQTAPRTDRVVGLLFVDLDGFKEVNDTLGHAFGDALLCCAADRLRAHVRASDTVARLGGDEFVVLLTNVRRAEDVHSLARKLECVLEEPTEVEGQILRPGASIGSASGPADGSNPQDLLAAADAAMYEVKRARKSGKSDASARRAEHDTRAASASAPRNPRLLHDLRLAYIPHFDVESAEISAFEVLPCASTTETSPCPFDPTSRGDADPLHRPEELLETFFCELESDLARSEELRNAPRISICLPGRLVLHPVLPRLLEQILPPTTTGSTAAPGLVECTLQPQLALAQFTTSPPAWTHPGRVELALRLGPEQSFDELVQVLRSLELACVYTKSDQLGAIHSDRVDQARLSSLTTLLTRLQIRFGVAGIETVDDAAKLHELGVRFMQGPLFSEPLPADELAGARLRDCAWRPKLEP